MLKNVLIVVGGAVGILLVYAFLVPMLQNPNAPSDDDMIVCTMDAKICPDGTGVGRVGPSCEFAPCPGE